MLMLGWYIFLGQIFLKLYESFYNWLFFKLQLFVVLLYRKIYKYDGIKVSNN